MHKPIRDYLHRIKTEHPELFDRGKIVEFGSLNINGTPRDFFETAEYWGVDAFSGEGVDKVSLCHRFRCEDKSIDLVISTEMLEHDPYWDLSIERMVRLVANEGSLIITAAGPHRHPHGQRDYTPIGEYYRNLRGIDILSAVLKRGRFKKVCLENNGDVDLMLFCYWRY